MLKLPIPLICEDDVFAVLGAGALLLTINNRLARELQHRYDRVQQVKGLTVWETPQILPWSVWLQRCYDYQTLTLTETDNSSPALLSPLQEQSLWERVIYDSPYSGALLQVPATVRTAQEAWRLWHAWRLPLAGQSLFLTEDTQAFLEWAQVFEDYCRVDHWLDNARLPDAVGGMLESGQIPLPGTVILAGFDEYTPQQQELLAVLERQGVLLQVFANQGGSQQTRRVALADTIEEITVAARWARHRLEHSPGEKIGVIVPELEFLRVQVARIFDDILHPEAVLPGRGRIERAYNLSLAQPLADNPLVHTALLILELSKGELSMVEMGAFLRSPFVGAAEQEFSHRALLDAYLRKTREERVSLERLWKAAITAREEDANHRCPALGERLQQFKVEVDSLPARQPPSGWAQSFTCWLQLLGWPGERPLDSEEYQAVSAWHKSIQSFSSLDRVVPSLKKNVAIGKFRHLLVETLFQPENPIVPVQVMGVLEAAGEQFDAAWMLGLHDGIWPTAPRPNPLLPIELQRHYRLPHASAERELAYTRVVTERLLASAPVVIVSHPRREGDRDLRPSPLIAELASVLPERLQLASVESYVNEIQQTGRMETLVDAQGPPLEAGAQVGGGTGLLKAQAACPFRAFAEYRLGAKGLEEPSVGLESLDQGILIHVALQYLWEKLQNQHTLLSCSAEELHGLIAEAAKQAIATQTAVRPRIFTERFTAIEQERLEQLLLEWLERDKQRPPFAVLHQERSQPLNLGGLSLDTRADRIDQLESGERVIVDYKTGRSNPRHWFGERPEEPQLPLYCIAHEAPLAAVLFAQVRRGEMKYLGVTKEEGSMPEVAVFTRVAGGLDSWEELLARWFQVLHALAVEVVEGYAAVAPRDANSCDYCALPGLCRIKELGGGAAKNKKERDRND
ncbi:DNA helicase/exodeoxyribonuclease V, subunit B [Nitrosococcus oceani ATCC 19707]|uniref:DNA helicase/exodeoxyribonuclease V, subunit B n=2 Tax=Nitrosococcus oceani TaxID=1229 RepID=Q3JCF0_NITOC|nr:PD-(D/E)XK nuclease family protein [Nitrosococcus oceani]ABA57496.1 DNA helicase/exodeoxyribonuclease V, subunit B [Nitrosococcus oceani ATCC 19707]KFI19994.1 DNA repair protein [Nitrosococcus oceani C-27]GEM20715.1 DNA repair protein [Nitrosococcus oceani]